MLGSAHIKIPALTTIALAAALSLSACGTPAPEPGHADRLAVAVLNNLVVNKAEAAIADFTPAMARTLPAANLSQKWKRYQEVLGDYRSHGQPQDVAQGPLTVVNLPLAMAQKPGHLQVTVDQSGHIAGLFLLE
jgi:hypothetical protein